MIAPVLRGRRYGGAADRRYIKLRIVDKKVKYRMARLGAVAWAGDSTLGRPIDSGTAPCGIEPDLPVVQAVE